MEVAPATPVAGDIYRTGDTARYRDTANVERLLLNAPDNLANLTNPATARTNLGIDIIASSVYYQTPVNVTIPLSAKAAFAFTINQIRGLKTASGTLTLSIQIDGVNVTGLTSIAVTSTAQDVAGTAANAVAINGRVTVVIASVSSPVDLEFTLRGVR